MRGTTIISRRHLLGAIVVGSGALLTACGSSLPQDPAPRPAEPAVGVASSGGAVSSTLPQSPPKATPASRIATATPASAPPPVVDPTAQPTATSTVAPTATTAPTSTPIPTATPVPTATPIPYDASRLVDVLGESVTSYAGSVPPRVHNVQLATRLINGAKVAPGEVFSFDDRVGDQTEAHGFQVAWGIVSKDGAPETVKADAGGICQVATTVFQAAYWAGLPIVRRYHHLYWIAHYGQPPYGGLGLDATVDFPPVDLQFRNTTSDWIRIDATYDPTHVRVRIVGVSPGWKVTSSAPKVSNLVKVDRTVVRREDPTLPAGVELQVEAAEDGFDVTVERLVKSRTGEIVDRYVFTNHYEPAHNVVVYGSRGGTPTPTPVPATPTPAVPTPAPASPPPTAASSRLPDGRIRVPALIGMPEAAARQLVTAVGLQNSYTNYQGPGDVPPSALNQVPVGAVLSQIPPPGTIVGPGSTVYIAVRKA